MPLQLDSFQDQFGNTYPAAYAVIERIATDVPPNNQVTTFVRFYKDAAAEAAGFEALAQRKELLTFDPFADGAANAAYTELSQSGGVYTGSTIVP
jgi:hypothetical protein